MVAELRSRHNPSVPSGSRQGAIRLGAVVLAASAILFPLAIAFSGSFTIDERGILLAGATVVACVALAVVVVRRPHSRRARTGDSVSPEFREE